MGNNKPYGFTSQNKHQMCLIGYRWGVLGQKIHQNVCLPQFCPSLDLIGKAKNCRFCICKALHCDSWPFPGNTWVDLARVNQPSQYLIKLTSNVAQNCGTGFSLAQLRIVIWRPQQDQKKIPPKFWSWTFHAGTFKPLL